MEPLDRDMLFVALSRPQMLFGVTYAFAVVNGIVTTELFLIFRSLWVIAFALVLHLVGAIACLRDPHIFELWLTKVQRCPRVKNFRIWHCNSYRA